MLDINLFRKEKGFNPEVVRESQRRRFGNVDLVDEVIELDKECRQRRFELDNLRKDSNRISKEVSRLKAAKQDASELIKKNSEENKKVTAVKEKEVKDAHATLDERLEIIGNLVHDTVPVSDNEENNVIIRHWGDKRTDSGLKNHVELVNLLGIVDMVKGAAVAGSRGYYLLGAGYNLNQALISFAVDFLCERGYTPLRTPSLMRKDVMAKCAQLSQFHEELYKVTGDGDDKNPTATSEQPRCRDDKDLTTTSEGDDQNITTTSEGDDKNSRLTSQQPSCRDDKYLTATSEQPLCALHMDDCIDPPKLPIRYAGISTCFRKEAGSHGRDTLGIFRVHEFDKVEQFCITSPNGNDSWEMHEEMIKNSEEFYQKLKIPYQVVSIVSGALNDAAAKKYDLEGWFPASATYRELVSCSNCTDYQSRKLNIRYGHNKGQYVHLLNSTLTATQRTICCILENYQREDGVEVPEVLRPYMRNVAFLPFKSIPNGESKKSKSRLV